MTKSAQNDRTVLEITGVDRMKFLQDLVTNDVSDLGEQLVYAALLSPQGKYAFDFFLFQRGETVFLDVKSTESVALVGRLGLYKLRADVAIGVSALQVSRGVEMVPEGAFRDPRHQALGWRYYGPDLRDGGHVDWDDIRVANLIPETGVELISGESYILEMGFERLNGVDFRKGCYVGQEITARMKHKATLRKGLARVLLGGSASPGSLIEIGAKSVGTLHTVAGQRGLAHVRFDQAGEGMLAGGVSVVIDPA